MNRIQYTSCPFCVSKEIKIHLHVKDHKISQESFHISECENCHLRFTSDPPEAKDIAPYYDSPRYISHSNNTTGIINKAYHLVRKIMLNKKLSLIRSLSKADNIIDIGCGTGYFLNTMKENNYKTTGIEINENARKFAQTNFGLDVFPPEFLTENKLIRTFDLASMWHVLEHIYQPGDFIQSIYKVLNTDALFIIAVPNYKSQDANHYKEDWAGYDVPRHLWHFEPSTIKNLLSENGFEFKSMHRLPFDSFYVSMLSESYKHSSFKTIKGVWHGGWSWINSLFHIHQTSSLIYIFQKKS